MLPAGLLPQKVPSQKDSTQASSPQLQPLCNKSQQIPFQQLTRLTLQNHRAFLIYAFAYLCQLVKEELLPRASDIQACTQAGQRMAYGIYPYCADMVCACRLCFVICSAAT